MALVEQYLCGRGITIPIPPTIRFHANLRHPSGIYAPAMVAAVEHARSGNAVIGIHRTWLRDDGGGKAALDPQKAALGPIAGGAVRLAPAGKILCLCEGIEDGLSILQATGIPTWATLGTSNLLRVELPEIVSEVIVCADNDAAGERAAHQAAARFLREARRVRIARPPRRQGFQRYEALKKRVGRVKRWAREVVQLWKILQQNSMKAQFKRRLRTDKN